MGSHVLRSRVFASKKFAALLALCMCHSLVIVQEAHGGPEAVLELQRRLHLSRLILFSCTSSTAAGGLLFCISRTFLSTCTHYYFDVMIPGRVAILSLFFPSGALVIAGIHLLPALRTLQRAALLRRLSRRLPSPHLATSILAGDWNFLPSGEPLFNYSAGTTHLRDDGTSAAFDNFVPLLRRTLPIFPHPQVFDYVITLGPGVH